MVLHANAALSLKKRLLLCERVVEQEWTLTKAAADVALYERLVAADPKHPDLPSNYEKIQEQNRRVRELYTTIDELRRRLGAASRPL